ncbi:14219_t:CDS:2 [Funneliformis geosporum]|nr:14219_t:CDS:2 [Funneliformis geosporum]
MHLSSECLEDLKYLVFWEQSEEPSLMKFLNFRLHAQDLEDEVTEHNRYKNELKAIKKHYDETSDVGQKRCGSVRHEALFDVYNSRTTLRTARSGKTAWERLLVCLGKNDKNSKQINHFWVLQVKRRNISIEMKLLEEKSKLLKKQQDMYSKTNDLINSLETGYHAFDGIFNIDEPDTISHCKFRTRDPWWTKKQTNKDKKDMEM